MVGFAEIFNFLVFAYYPTRKYGRTLVERLLASCVALIAMNPHVVHSLVCRWLIVHAYSRSIYKHRNANFLS